MRLDPGKNHLCLRRTLPSHLAAHARRESPPKPVSRLKSRAFGVPARDGAGGLQIRIVGPDATLHDADDFRSFSVAVVGSSVAAARDVLSVLGPLDDDLSHVFVDGDWIVEQAGPQAQSAEWREKYATMVSFAERHGWVDAKGRIRAHIELTD